MADDGPRRNSPFTEALLAHIETPGLSVNDMFGKVIESVAAATNGAQVPWQSSSLLGDPVRLAAVAPPPPPEAKDTATPPVAGTPSPSSGEAARAYEAAARLNTVAAYRLVVEAFPGTTYAKLAQTQIAELERKADDAAFARAKGLHTERGYRAYLKSCDVCGHESEAEVLLAEVTKPPEWASGKRFRDCSECPEMAVCACCAAAPGTSFQGGLRSADRLSFSTGNRSDVVGFRVARTLTP